nr:hypothetical protein [Tanacetum cinerariifolium]
MKKGRPKGRPFYMLAICKADKPIDFKAPRTSSHTGKKDSQGKNLEAKSGHKKQSSSKHPSVSNIEATKVGVTSEDGANPQLSSDSTTEADPGNSAPNDSLPP